MNRSRYSVIIDRNIDDRLLDHFDLLSIHIGIDLYANAVYDSEIPSNLILKKISPQVWLPALVVMWGIVCMCLGFVKNYAEFMVVRAILGLTEGGLLPGMVSGCLISAAVQY